VKASGGTQGDDCEKCDCPSFHLPAQWGGHPGGDHPLAPDQPRIMVS
jgi:hypothetical protein